MMQDDGSDVLDGRAGLQEEERELGERRVRGGLAPQSLLRHLGVALLRLLA
jgi:hypothetical protein